MFPGVGVTGGAPVWSPDGSYVEGTHGEDIEVNEIRGATPGRLIPADGHTGHDSWQTVR
jgi:hypothetical protein